MKKSTLLFNQKPDPHFNTRISIPVEMLEKFFADFYPWCEIEILSGEKKEFNDRVEFNFNLDDEKKKQFKEFLMNGFTNNFDKLNDN